MKLSLNGIKDYVDLQSISQEQIIEELNRRTACVKSVQQTRHYLDQVIVGEIVSVQMVLQEENLMHVKVNCGYTSISTVSTANNVRIGLKTAVALQGALLNNKQFVKLREIGGVEVRGKMCSPKDLGICNQSDELVEFDQNVEIGKPLSKMLPESDVCLTLDREQLANRPELNSPRSFAKELADMFDLTLKPVQEKRGILNTHFR